MIYHWTTKEKAATALRTGKLQARRWQHFLEHEQRFAKGSSWSMDATHWQRDNEVCLVVDEAKLQNQLHHINGNRTYWLTMGMTKADHDPKAYLNEPTTPDEVFVEGTVDMARSLLSVKTTSPAVQAFLDKAIATPTSGASNGPKAT